MSGASRARLPARPGAYYPPAPRRPARWQVPLLARFRLLAYPSDASSEREFHQHSKETDQGLAARQRHQRGGRAIGRCAFAKGHSETCIIKITATCARMPSTGGIADCFMVKVSFGESGAGTRVRTRTGEIIERARSECGCLVCAVEIGGGSQKGKGGGQGGRSSHARQTGDAPCFDEGLL